MRLVRGGIVVIGTFAMGTGPEKGLKMGVGGGCPQGFEGTGTMGGAMGGENYCGNLLW